MTTLEIDWRRNLRAVWLSQVLSIMGFSFAMPFVAYFIQQDLGITDKGEAMMWHGWFLTSAPFSMAIAAPIWGKLADRYGRKIMMLRANFGAAIILLLMGFAPNVHVLIVLRIGQGILTGTISAAQTLVASYTPARYQGRALGAMSAAIFAGSSLGLFLGGRVSHSYGYREAFFVAGAVLLCAGLITLIFVRERFVRDASEAPRVRWRLRLPSLGFSGPIILLLAAMSAVRQFDNAVLPFMVQQLNFGLEGAELRMSYIGLLYCAGAFAGGFIWGRMADRVRPTSLAKVCALAAACTMVPQMLAQSFLPLMIGRMAMAFFAGGLGPVLTTWLSRVTPPERRGSIFGWCASARSLGWGIAPYFSARVGSTLGPRYSFFGACVSYVLLILLISFVANRVAHPVTDGIIEKISPS